MPALPSVLLLDLDDTILDNSGARDRCWQAVCDEAARRHDLDASHLFAAVESANRTFWAGDRSRQGRLSLADSYGEIVADALASFGIDDRVLAAELGVLHHRLRTEAMAPMEGALETLHELRRRGVTLGLITNGAGEIQRAKIERFALAAHFAYIGIEGEVGHGKPHRIAYETALAALGVEASDCWMVGDNLEWDVAGAQAVGIRGIWLDKAGAGVPEDVPTRPDAVVRSIAELLR